MCGGFLFYACHRVCPDVGTDSHLSGQSHEDLRTRQKVVRAFSRALHSDLYHRTHCIGRLQAFGGSSSPRTASLLLAWSDPVSGRDDQRGLGHEMRIYCFIRCYCSRSDLFDLKRSFLFFSCFVLAISPSKNVNPEGRAKEKVPSYSAAGDGGRNGTANCPHDLNLTVVSRP